ncbi:MAG TPA: hypothetical protein VN375_12015 [Vicinamibacteria bacterium]|jgi:hypothetical protein|nr:hypothetical protein [Vicinamibacteria bacterium]
MDSWAVLFLGVIALSSLVQAVFLIGLAVGGRRLARRLDEMQKGIDREIRPTLDNLSRITRNLAEIADLATLQARRVDDVLADTVDKIEEATDMIRRVILRPLGPLVDVAAFLKGLRRGVQVYRKLRGLESQGRGSSRRNADEDEHLFI